MNIKKELFQSLRLLFIALILSLGVSYVFAWTGPTGTAPNNNTPAPINVSATSQVKSGGLGVTSFTADSATLGSLNTTGTARFTGYGTDTWFPYSNGWNYLRGNTYFNGGLYDENNGNYYLDPAGTSRINYGIFDNVYSYSWIQSGSSMYSPVYYDYNNSGYYMDPNNTSITNDMRANIYYDQGNTGYYVDPNNTSRMNYTINDNVYTYGWAQANIFYDAYNNGYYLQPRGTSNLNNLCLNGSCLNTFSGTVAGTCQGGNAPVYPATSCWAWSCGYGYAWACWGVATCASGWTARVIGGDPWDSAWTYACVKN